jgi:uncharacterized membrane protein YgaE (UPF0421/DUF939 family)
MDAVLSTIIGSAISGIIAVVTCIINSNVQRVKEQAEIEKKIDGINANYDKQSALIKQQIETLTEHVNKHNDLINRMYRVEQLTEHLDYMIRELKEDDRR